MFWNKYVEPPSYPSYLTSVSVYLTGETDIEAAKAVLDSLAATPPPAQIGSEPTTPKTPAPDTTMSESTTPKTPAPDKPEKKRQDEDASDERASVEDTIRGYYEALGAGDFEEAYSYLGPTYKKAIDYNKQIWIDSQESEQITDSTINSVKVQRVSEDEATATVDVAFQDEGKDSRFFLEWMLVKEGEQWKLDEQLSGERI
ncbi:MAG TPA: hypothetical protein VK902_17875 [Rubrobacter sp.]|nr:hypothetical protein [Rubrobacter sp.]